MFTKEDDVLLLLQEPILWNITSKKMSAHELVEKA